MKLYVTVCEDHIVDPEIKIWSNKDKAIDYAKEFIKSYEDFTETSVRGLLYSANMCENYVYVFETTLNE